jgi:acyl-CoA thioesterase-1
MNVWLERGRRKGATALYALVIVALAAGSTAASAETLRLLALGDSLTAGYGLAKPDAFTTQLEAALKAVGEDVQVINGGVSGDTSAGGRARLGWALADNPHAVIVELGANDGLRGLDPAQTLANLDAILTETRAKGIPVLLSGMLAPPNLGAEYGAEFRQLYRDLAAKHDVLFDPFFLEGVAAEPELNQADAIHPNAKGVAVIVERLLPMVRKLVAMARTRL